jgi:glucose-6-phosphate dehydrogenase assembly protein OpcA
MEDRLMPGLTDTLSLENGSVENLRQIEEMLTLLWGEDEHSVRACMDNLIVYLEREDDRNDILQIVQEVVRSRPSRVILMFAYPDLPEEPIQVSVSAYCWLEGPSQERVCSEQIRIRTTGKKVFDLPGLVASLIVSDLPVHLWWRDRFLDRQELFEKFVDNIDHVIFEGLHWKNLPEKVKRIAELTHRLQGKVAVTNFNWSRLQPWQQRIAQFFDKGLYGRELDHIRRVSIEFHTSPAQAEGREFQAFLLCGWLAGQLGWKLKSGSRKATAVQLQLHAESGKEITIDIDHEVIPAGTKGIQGLRLDFDNPGAPFTFTMDRDPENQLLFLQIRKEGACSMPQKVRHLSASPATLLLRGMEHFQSSIVFERAFANAVDFLNAVSK